MYNSCFYSSMFSKRTYVLALSLFCAHAPISAMDQPAQAEAELRHQPTWLSLTAGNIYNSPLAQNIYQVLTLLAQGSQPSFTIVSSPELGNFLENIDQRISHKETSVRLKEAEKERDDDTEPIQSVARIVDCNPFAATHYYRNTQLGQSIEECVPQLVQSAKQSRLVMPITLIGLSAVTGRHEFGYIAIAQGAVAPIQGLIESGLSLAKTIKTPPHNIPQPSSNNYASNQYLQINNPHQNSSSTNALIPTNAEDAHIQAPNNQPEKSDTLTFIKESGKAVKEVTTVVQELQKLLDTANPIIEKIRASDNAQPLTAEQRIALDERSSQRTQSIATTTGHLASACRHLSTGAQSMERTLNSPTAGRTVAQAAILSALGLGGAKLAYNKLSKDKVTKQDAIIAGIGGSTAVISLLLTWQIMQAPCNDQAEIAAVPLENVRT